jgi:uncharacterized protein affecting Mg2+/Co2+ transport
MLSVWTWQYKSRNVGNLTAQTKANLFSRYDIITQSIKTQSELDGGGGVLEL